jgi:hypothetical protein
MDEPPDFSHLVDADFVIVCFEEATETLMALIDTGYTTALAQSHLDVIRDFFEAYGRQEAEERNRKMVPAAAKITAMDEIFVWLSFIPERNRTLRKIVGLRGITRGSGNKPMSWRKIGRILGADDKAVKIWHSRGIEMIVRELNRPGVMTAMRGFPDTDEIAARADHDQRSDRGST